MFRYHLGSLAFGSLILAIIQMVRLLFEYFRKTMSKVNPATATPIVQFLLKIASCALWCLDRFVKFINQNAYIQIALGSDNFCMSAYKAFCLILLNVATFSFVSGVGGFIMFLGKCVIVISTGFLGFLIIYVWPWINDNISSPFLAVLVIMIIAYVISSFFMSVYSVASNTILQCFLLDNELAKARNGGEPDHRPDSLEPFIRLSKEKKAA